MDYESKLTFFTPMFSHSAIDALEICADAIRKYCKDVMGLGMKP